MREKGVVSDESGFYREGDLTENAWVKLADKTKREHPKHTSEPRCVRHS